MTTPIDLTILPSWKQKAIDALLLCGSIQHNGATDQSGGSVDNIVVNQSNAQLNGQARNPLFLPLDKLNPTLSEQTRLAESVTMEQAVFAQIADNAQLPTFLAVAKMLLDTVDGLLLSDKFVCTTRTKYGLAVAVSDTAVQISDTGNVPHSTGPGITGVPVDADVNANYVEILSAVTGLPLTVSSGPQTGERVYGVMVNAGSSPDTVQFDLYSRPLGGDPAGTRTPYTWELGQPTTINVAYGFRQRLDQLDDAAFRRVFR